MTQAEEWQEWRRIYATLSKEHRREVFRGAVDRATRPRSWADRRAGALARHLRQLSGRRMAWRLRWRALFFGFPSGAALIHGVLVLALLGTLPPAADTPPALLGIGYVVSLNVALWLWWGVRRVARDDRPGP